MPTMKNRTEDDPKYTTAPYSEESLALGRKDWEKKGKPMLSKAEAKKTGYQRDQPLREAQWKRHVGAVDSKSKKK